MDGCPPGYYPSNGGCHCSVGTSEELYGVTKCNYKCAVYLNPQFWAGYMNIEGKHMLMTSNCPKDYCNNTRLQLPNSTHTSLDNLVCSHHRTGYVCGNCQNGYYVYINCPSYHCGPCNDTLSDHGYLYTLASKYVPLTLMMSYIIFFDISLVDGPLNSFILSSQLISLQRSGKISITFPAEGTKVAKPVMKTAMFLYDIWNLVFIESLLPHYCAYKSDTAMPVIVSEYIPAFYVLFFCIIFFTVIPWICKCCSHSNNHLQNCVLKIERMCIRVRYRWSVKNSIIHSLTTFVVLSYAKITSVTFQVLTPLFVYGPGGQDSHYKKTVVWYDGTMPYFGHDHFPYAMIALFMLIIFVLIPPLLLLSYPLLPVLLTRLGLQDCWIVKKLIINPLSKCVPIFDAFQSCYKDEYRFFAGLLFVYRIVASAISAFTPTPVINLAWLQGFLLLILLIHCTCQPYKKRWHNCIEGFTFIILASIITITFYRLFQATTSTPTTASFWMQIILMYCPLVYFILYTSVKVFTWLHPRIVVVKGWLCGIDNTNPSDVANLFNSREFPARMEANGSKYSTASRNISEPLIPQQQQQQQDDDDDDNVEMIHPVEWNDTSQ